MKLRIPPLETERLRIRELHIGDLDDCHRLNVAIDWTDPGLSDEKNRERRHEWLDWTIRSYQELDRLYSFPYGERAVELADDGEFVGLVGLVPMIGPFAQLESRGGPEDSRMTTEVGLFWAVLPERQRQGIAAEAAGALIRYAFEDLRLARICAGTEYDNAASIAVMKKLGMRVDRNAHAEPEWFQAVGILEA